MPKMAQTGLEWCGKKVAEPAAEAVPALRRIIGSAGPNPSVHAGPSRLRRLLQSPGASHSRPARQELILRLFEAAGLIEPEMLDEAAALVTRSPVA